MRSGLTKVGKSANLKSRLRGLQIQNADELIVEHIIFCHPDQLTKTEKYFHEWLKPGCKHGEWFAIPEGIMCVLHQMKTHLSIPEIMEQRWLSTPIKNRREEPAITL